MTEQTRVPALQLYSLRYAIDKNAGTTFDRIHAVGIREVEIYDLLGHANLWSKLPDHGLVAVSSHADLTSAGLSEVAAVARSLRIPTVIAPHIDPARWSTRAGVQSVAHEINDAAARLVPDGLAVGYHNHAFEFAAPIEGGTAYDLFCGILHPDVRLEVDVYWAAVAGQPVGELLSRNAHRVDHLHIKDGTLDGDVSRQVPAGDGQIPLATALLAAPTARRIIEFDDYSGDLFAGIATALTWLDGQ